MRAHIILGGMGGKLDQRTVTADDADELDDLIEQTVLDLAAESCLTIGDSITIVEG